MKWSRQALFAIIAGSIILHLSFGIRTSFGLFLTPISQDFGWGREVFAFSMAIQNLLWGLGQPFAGAFADRFGARRVVLVSIVMYLLGLWLMANTTTVMTLNISVGVMIGFALSGTAFGLVIAAVGKVTPPENRSMALGIVAAAGSSGQLLMVPIGQAFLTAYGWNVAIMLLLACGLLMLLAAPGIPGKVTDPHADNDLDLVSQLKEAFGHRSYVLLTVGFFVCGWHVAFISVHLPSYVTDFGLDPQIGAWALSLVGLFNVVGSYLSGAVGVRYSKSLSLAWIYGLRSLVIAVYLVLPVTATTTLIFASCMGLLWLSTVPLTSALVGQFFGPRYLGTLFGIVFFSHQIGSFLGVWLGGLLYDRFQSYDVIWWTSVILGIVAMALHLPIDERPIERLRKATA